MDSFRQKLLNLGCGSRFHPAWVNLDIAPQSPSVIKCDLSRGVPYPDNTFDAAYHSHVLEHIRRVEAPSFMRECYRVLKPGGILRVAVPDLERICRLYLDRLERVAGGDSRSLPDYEWMVLEMYDQTVREKSGGGMLEYFRQNPMPNEAFVFERMGQEARGMIEAIRSQAPTPHTPPPPPVWPHGFANKVRHLLDLIHKNHVRPFLLRRCFGPDTIRPVEIGCFRLEGEVHQWMYDRVSLSRLMKETGFSQATLCAAGQSGIRGWKEFGIEVMTDGSTIKPDSLFMEAVKPVAGSQV